MAPSGSAAAGTTSVSAFGALTAGDVAEAPPPLFSFVTGTTSPGDGAALAKTVGRPPDAAAAASASLELRSSPAAGDGAGEADADPPSPTTQ